MNELAKLIDEAADELRRENDYYEARAAYYAQDDINPDEDVPQ